ncbi:MAG: cytochrome P450 [Myxococcota bacterium]|nr:cytochrome P450 [Myxococcota bacterium]
MPPTTSTTTSDYDPFEEFSRAQGAGEIDDPYPDFARYRAASPLVEIDPATGEIVEPGSPRDTPTGFAAVSYDAVQEVLRDGERFSSAMYRATMGPVMGHSILEMDEPEHARHRALIQQAFTKRALERWEHDLVRPTIDALIDRIAERGRADLVRELTFPFPVMVIAEMIGLPESRLADFHRWAVELISIQIDPERGMAGSQNLRALFAEVLAERRAEPRQDLMSVLAGAELDGQQLDDESIFAFLRLLAPAGAETTYRSSSNLLVGLLGDPDSWDAVSNDRSLVANAIEEGLRWECPLTGIIRTATRDTEVCGVPVADQTAILVNLGSANHDEAKFASPRRFDVRRPNARQHLAFAFGPHRCLGQHLAIMETRVLLEQLFTRLPNLRLDPEAPAPAITGLMFRSPPKLEVVFDPR